MAAFEARKQTFKKTVGTEDGRRRRGETTIKLRKEKKEEGLAKRRNLAAALKPTEQTPNVTNSGPAVVYTIADIPKLVAGVKSSELQQQVDSTKGFRRLLSAENNPPVDEVLAAQVIDIFVLFLSREDSAELQFEAAWTLTNIASTDKTAVVVEHGAVPPLVKLLTSQNADVREQSAWCLGNISGDCTELRDQVLASGALEPLLLNISQPANASLLRNCVWTLSNFCRGKPQPAVEAIGPAVPVLSGVVSNCTDPETLVDACWALSYLSDGDDVRIQTVVDSGVVPALVRHCAENHPTLTTPALRTIGNIVTGNDSQTQSVVDCGVLNLVVPLLNSNRKAVRKETCWMISNIAAGTRPQIATVVDTPQLLTLVVQQLSNGEWDVRKEACWVISNIASGGDWPHIQKMVDHGCILPLCNLLEVADPKITLIALETLEKILEQGEANEACYQVLVDEADGLDKLEKMQEHENEQIYETAVRIIEGYFGADEEDENLAPATEEGGGKFQFGVANEQVPVQGFQF